MVENMKALCCPICNKKMMKKLRRFNCMQGHSFDIAKEGYVNLLLPNQKHSKAPGDSKDMIESRRAFLDKIYYKGISDNINKAILKNSNNINNSINIADIGCGEGYYLANFINELKQMNDIQYEAYGLDISRDAIRLAAKRTLDITWIVGNVFSLPFKDNSMDVLLCMFSMINFAECKRVLRKNGKLLFVTAGHDHLRQIREIIYPKILEARESELDKEKGKYLNFYDKLNIKYDTLVKSTEDISNLLMMTPHYWKIREERKQELYRYHQLDITVDVDIEILSKQALI